MADNENTSDEEYQFSDVESTNVFGTQQEEDFSPKNVMRRNLIIGVGVIAVIFTVYKLLGIFFSPKQVKKISKPKTQITRIAPVKTSLPKVKQLAPVTFIPPKKASVDTKAITKLKTNLESFVKAEVATNKSEIERLDTNINNIKMQLTEINNRLSEINTTTKMLNEMIVKMKTPPPRKRRVRRKPRKYLGIPRARQNIYYIQAIIPGRAWLKSKKGSTLTINEGARLPGYGSVVSIDPQQGQVLTSSGRTIRYSPENR